MQGEQEGASPDVLRGRTERSLTGDLHSSRFGLYDEGNGVFSLYLSPIHLPTALQALRAWTVDRVVAVLGPGEIPVGAIPVRGGGYVTSADAILDLDAPSEAVVFSHAPSAAELDGLLPSSLLACPQGALPEVLGAEFGLILPDSKHMILLTRDRSLLLHVLELFLNHHHGAGKQLPRIEGPAGEEILESIEPWAWRRVSCSEEGGVQRMAIETMDSERSSGVSNRLEWVAPVDGGYWRSGWSW